MPSPAFNERVLVFLRNHPDATARVIATEMTGQGAARSKGRRQVGNALRALESQGKAVRTKPETAYHSGGADKWNVAKETNTDGT